MQEATGNNRTGSGIPVSLHAGITLPGQPDLENVRRLDLLPVPMIRRMQRRGIAIDIPYCRELSSRFGSNMAELEKDIASYIPAWALHQFVGQAKKVEEEEGDARLNANSAEQIGSLLFDVLKVGAGKKLKTTSGGKRVSTGKKQLELLRNDHPVVPLILKYREYSKLKTTYTDALPDIAIHHPRGECPVCEMDHEADTFRIHTEFPTTRAATGRLASRGPNLQNIPARTEEGRAVRAAFLASPGYRLASSDFSQIELRDAAHCTHADSMIRVYQERKDIHIYTACRAFNLDYDHFAWLAANKDELDKQQKEEFKAFSLNQRMPSKNLNFMILYGASWQGLQAQLALSGLFWSKEECENFIERWFSLYPEVQAYLDLQAYRARRYGFVWDLFGRIRLTPEVRSPHTWIRAAGIRQGGNHPIQSVAAGQMKLAMGRLEIELLELLASQMNVYPLLTIHDELVVEAEEDIVEGVKETMEHFMSEVMRDATTQEWLWDVPIEADGKVMERWVKD